MVSTLRVHAELEAVFAKPRVDLVICGGAFRLVAAKFLRPELRRRSLPVVLLRHHDRPLSLAWLRQRLGRGAPLLSARLVPGARDCNFRCARCNAAK